MDEMDEKNMEMLGVTLVRKTDSKNKFLRMRWEDEGAKLYFSKISPGKYLFSKDPDKGTEVVVKQVTAPPIYRYITVNGLIEENGYMSVLRDADGNYLVRESTDEEARRLARRIRPFKESGQCRTSAIFNTNVIALTNRDFRRLWKTPTLIMRVVMTDTKLFIEAKAALEQEAAIFPTYVNAVSCYGGHGNLRTMREVALSYRLDYVAEYYMRLPVPISFARRAGFTDQDILNTWFKNDDTLVIEGKPIICDSCGREINRYFDLTNYVCTCAECKAKLDAAPDIQKRIIRETPSDEYDRILDDLKDLRDKLFAQFAAQHKNG